jgi:hypothetical protein
MAERFELQILPRRGEPRVDTADDLDGARRRATAIADEEAFDGRVEVREIGPDGRPATEPSYTVCSTPGVEQLFEVYEQARAWGMATSEVDQHLAQWQDEGRAQPFDAYIAAKVEPQPPTAEG